MFGKIFRRKWWDERRRLIQTLFNKHTKCQRNGFILLIPPVEGRQSLKGKRKAGKDSGIGCKEQQNICGKKERLNGNWESRRRLQLLFTAASKPDPDFFLYSRNYSRFPVRISGEKATGIVNKPRIPMNETYAFS